MLIYNLFPHRFTSFVEHSSLLRDAINANLKRVNVAPEVKKDKILSQFAFIKDTVKLNEIEPKLNKTPLKHFSEYLNEKIYKSLR